MLNYLIERFDSVGMEERKAPKVTGRPPEGLKKEGKKKHGPGFIAMTSSNIYAEIKLESKDYFDPAYTRG